LHVVSGAAFYDPSFVAMADMQQAVQQLQQMLSSELQSFNNGIQQQLNQLQAQVAPLIAANNAQQAHMPVVAPDPVAAVHVDPRAVNKPEKFVGKLAEVRTFLDAMEDYLRVINVPLDSSAAVVVASSFLDGPARQWWSFAKNDINNFNDFRTQLQKRFTPVDEALEARYKLRSLRQKGSAKEYTDHFNAIILPLRNSNADDLIFAYVAGLKEKVRQHVLAARPRTLEDAMELAVSLDRDLWQSAKHTSQSPRGGFFPTSRYQQSAATSTSGAAPMELGAIDTRRPVGNKVEHRQRQPVCWRCGKMGHKMAQCKGKSLRPSN
jgi:hypothetical protein